MRENTIGKPQQMNQVVIHLQKWYYKKKSSFENVKEIDTKIFFILAENNCDAFNHGHLQKRLL